MMLAKTRLRALPWAAAARRLFTSMAADNKPLYRRLSALNGDPGSSVAQTMNEWISEGKTVTPSWVMNTVRELRKYRRYNHALELIDWMETRGMGITTSSHAIRIRLIANVKGINAAEVYFFGLPDLDQNLQTYGALLSCYCLKEKTDKAIALYEKMKALNLISGWMVHNNLMSLYFKLGEHEKVQAIFEDMKAENIHPNGFTYSILINSYSSLNDIDSVEMLIREMKDERISFNWPVYINLAVAYKSAGLREKAESALKLAEPYMGRSNQVAFHYLLSLYAGLGNLTEVIRVWNSLKTSITNPSNMSHYAMLKALSKLDAIDALKQCFEDWESNHVSYDIRLVNVIMDAYLRKDMLKEAEILCKKAMEKGIDVRTLELFLNYFLKRQEMDSALKFFDVAISRVNTQGKLDGGKLSESLKYVKDVDEVESFINHLKKHNWLDGEDYEYLISTYVTADKKESLLYKGLEGGEQNK